MSSNYFENLDLFLNQHRVIGFKKIKYIHWMADSILNDIPLVERAKLAETVQRRIDEEIEFLIEEEIHCRAKNICEHGGWELNYAPPNSSYEETVYLLKNWPDSKHDQCPVSKAEDFDRIDVLLDLGDSFGSYEDIANALAINALIDLDTAAYWIFQDQKKSTQNSLVYDYQRQLSFIADFVIDAMEAVVLAKKILLDKQIIDIRSEAEVSFKSHQKEAKRNAARMNASDGGKKKNEGFRQAEVFIRQRWCSERQEYGNNKSAFARVYVHIVANSFVDTKGDPLKVTEQTISRKWLRD